MNEEEYGKVFMFFIYFFFFIICSNSRGDLLGARFYLISLIIIPDLLLGPPLGPLVGLESEINN